MRQVAAENHEDKNLIEHITGVFAKTGQHDAGKALLDQVGKEIVELNNKGVLAARSGDLEGAVQLLIQAVEQVPNLQFLVNAAKAIFALMDKKGWDEPLAARAVDYCSAPSAGPKKRQGGFGPRALRHGRQEIRYCHRQHLKTKAATF